jgi:hypothetical protein
VGDLGDLCLGSQNFAAAGERGGGIGAQALTFPFSFSHSSPFFIFLRIEIWISFTGFLVCLTHHSCGLQVERDVVGGRSKASVDVIMRVVIVLGA